MHLYSNDVLVFPLKERKFCTNVTLPAKRLWYIVWSISDHKISERRKAHFYTVTLPSSGVHTLSRSLFSFQVRVFD